MATDTLVTLQALPEHAPEINDLVIARKLDSNPAHPDFELGRIGWFRERGEELIRASIETSIIEPTESFARVAMFGGQIVGRAFAEVSPDKSFTIWRGLTTRPGFDGMGIGDRLEAERQDWARAVGRPARASIPESNRRSLRFFTERGFVVVGTIEPTTRLPFRFIEVERTWDR